MRDISEMGDISFRRYPRFARIISPRNDGGRTMAAARKFDFYPP